MDEHSFIAAAEALASASADCEWPDLAPGSALLIRRWLSPAECAAFYEACLQRLQWEQPQVRLFGKSHPVPRRHAFVGDPGVIYRWSGLEQRPQSWIEPLDIIRSRLADAGFRFNSVLANHYRGGADSMGWHADNEKELGHWPVVATVSLGEERRLAFKRRDGAARLSLDLPDGSLLLTSGKVQHYWLHGVTKSRRQLRGRVSLTFRHINGRYMDSKN
ncbi:Alkylated DNA repair dioxygenase AlkB [Microbulbifer donghaiensis]|uniref:Alkylated DNA repair dioxygenase AlkB n=1 Tax=Microbulbifer donghaiensis TaxID=494016 RepID=A0A1M4UBG9_9GAMM|nr:alpha-ketoglutarate-dependent dioxygenase AlkB [Microbulbifer donghaiensis]SHE54075.1 Alkylated DNA repair dioxygenase AlkB [Microbulbifer donghaiensis]